MSDVAERNLVTFLFSDIEGSTRLWEQNEGAMEQVLAGHDELAQRAVEEAGGAVFKHTGDGLAAAFERPRDAIAAAVSMQQALEARDWGEIGTLSARMGIHSGEAQHRDGDYFGRSVNRCARLMSIAHGGQILISGSAVGLLDDDSGDPWQLLDLGEHSLKDLSRPERVFQVEVEGRTRSFPDIGVAEPRPKSLPGIRTEIVDRADELARIHELLRSERLVTLVGIAGVGKTRLAVTAAEEELADWPDGVWFAHVSERTSPDDMALAVAEVMKIDIADPDGAVEALVESIAERRLLIVLDSCEAERAAALELIEALLRACEGVGVLVTSRERLRAVSERVLHVEPLDVPDAGHARVEELLAHGSVQLFVERANDVAPTFEVTDDNADIIAEICRRLDGLPMAIELAAAQIAALDPAAVLARLDGYIRRESNKSGLVSPHPTLDAALDWSFETLTARQRELFTRASVFDGGFDVASAEAVCQGPDLRAEDIAPTLAELVDKSLLATRRQGGTVRYWMYGVLREYAETHLSNADLATATRQAHLERYLALAKDSAKGLRGRDEAAWVERVDTEFRNIRRAQRWAVESNRLDEAAELVWATYPFAFGRIRYEIIDWAQEVLDSFGDALFTLRPQLVAIAGWGAAVRGDVHESARLGQQAAALEAQLGRRSYIPVRVQVVAAMLKGDLPEAGRFIADAKLAVGPAGDTSDLVEVLGLEAFIHAASGDQERAAQVIDQAMAMARELGNPSLLAWTLYQLGAIRNEVDPEAAGVALEHAIELADLVQNRYVRGIALMVWTHLQGRGNDVVLSMQRFGDVIEEWYQAGNWTNLSNTLRLFANFLADRGYVETAAVIIGALTSTAHRAPQSLQTGHQGEGLGDLYDRVLHGDLRHHATRGAVFSMRDLTEYCQAEIVRLTSDLDEEPGAPAGSTPVTR